MRARISLTALAVVVTLGACSTDTAIVLSIHAEDPEARATLRLELHLGAGVAAPADSDPRYPAAWWNRTVVDPQVFELAALLADGTYQLSLTPSQGLALDDQLVYAVVAFGARQDVREHVVGIAHPDDYLRFGDGEIRRVDVPLVAYDPDDKHAGITNSGCVWWNAPLRDGPAAGQIRDRAIVPSNDLDCDDFRSDVAIGCDQQGDCDDHAPDVHPGTIQGCSERDNDCCPETTADITDADGDGVKVCEGDCVDSGSETTIFDAVVPAAAIHPGQLDDSCDGVDQACARNTNDGCDGAVPDPDGDGYVTCHSVVTTEPRGVRQRTCERFPFPDCVEQGEAGGVPADQIHPGADDRECDGVDQDCNGSCDDGGPLDSDGDGFYRCAAAGEVEGGLAICPPSVADCNDDDPFQLPGRVELCDGLDYNCDGVLSAERRACISDSTVGMCALGAKVCTESANGQPRYGGCITDGSSPMLPPAFCTPCNGGGGPDPLTCNDGRFRRCRANTVTMSSDQACTMPFQDAVLAPCLACTVSIENGTNVNGWRVTLVDHAGVASGPSIVATQPALRVLQVGTATQGVLIKRVTVNNVTTYELVQVAPGAGECAPMECTAAMD